MDGIFGNSGAAPDAGQATGAGVGGPASGIARGPQAGGQPGITQDPNGAAGQGQQPGAPGEAGQGEAQQLILGKFRSPDEVYKAYQNLEPQLTRVTQENSRLRAQLLGSPQPAAQPGQPAEPARAPGQPQPLTDEALDTMWAQSPLQAINAVVAHAIESQVKPLIAPIQTVQQTLARQAWAGRVDTMLKDSQAYPGFEQLIPQITEIVQSNPFLLNLPEGQGLEWAYHRALGVALPSLTAGAQQMGIQAAYAGIAAKGAALVEGGTARQPTVQKTPEEQIVDGIFGNPSAPSVFRT